MTDHEEMENVLMSTMPQADRMFQTNLQKTLLSQLQTQRPQRQTPAWLTWAAALLIVTLAGAILFRSNVPAFSTASQTGDHPTVVVAMQEITAGTVITGEMVGLVTLAETLPERELFSDVAEVVGKTASTHLRWFQPVEAGFLDHPLIPEGYNEIRFPRNGTVEGLKPWDRVDMLALVDGAVRVVVNNIVLTDIAPESVTFAAPGWKVEYMGLLWRTETPYALRLHTGDKPATPDTTPVEYTFTSPVELPDDYQFDLIVSVPLSKSYLLANLPLDEMPYTPAEFWFKNIETLTIEDGRVVTVRMPKHDADNLDALINLDASLSYVPNHD